MIRLQYEQAAIMIIALIIFRTAAIVITIIMIHDVGFGVLFPTNFRQLLYQRPAARAGMSKCCPELRAGSAKSKRTTVPEVSESVIEMGLAWGRGGRNGYLTKASSNNKNNNNNNNGNDNQKPPRTTLKPSATLRTVRTRSVSK